jgi:hypothetical protein
MARIQFSKEVFEKLKNSSQDKDSAILLSAFDPNRPFKGQNKLSMLAADKSSSPKTKNKKKIHKKKKASSYSGPGIKIGGVAPNEPKIFSTMHFTENQKKEWLRSSKHGRRTIERNIIEAEKLKRVREISSHFRSTHSSFFLTSTSNHKTTSRPKQSSKSKPIYDSRGNDSYNFAGEYSARNVEYGHGRRKSDEWNDSAAYDLKKELDKLWQIRKDDPNTFDRQAMK